MSIAIENRGGSLRGDKVVPLLDEPPLGHVQALVLKELERLGSDAYGFKVVEELTLAAGRHWVDQSQIYTTIRRLKAEDMIELKETRKQAGTPPLKIYKLTAAGRAALKVTAAHYVAVGAYLNNNKR